MLSIEAEELHNIATAIQSGLAGEENILAALSSEEQDFRIVHLELGANTFLIIHFLSGLW